MYRIVTEVTSDVGVLSTYLVPQITHILRFIFHPFLEMTFCTLFVAVIFLHLIQYIFQFIEK